MVEPTIRPWLLTASLWVLLATAVAMVGLIVGSRVVRAARRERQAALEVMVRPLVLAIAAEEDEEQQAAARLRSLTGPVRRLADEHIIGMLSKVRGDAARTLVDILRAHGQVDRAVRGVRSWSAVRRASSAWTLGLMGEVRHAADLVPLLGDRRRDVKIAAARALGAMGDPEHAAAVLQAVAPHGRRSGLPVWVAVDCLTRLGEGADPAVRAGLGHPSPSVRLASALAADHGARAGLTEAVRDVIAGEGDELVLAAALSALGQFGSASDVAVLSPRLRSGEHPVIRAAAAAAAREIGSPTAAPLLLPLLDDADPRVAESASLALLGLGAPARAELRRRADDDPGPGGRASRYALQLDALGGTALRGA